MTTPPYYRPGAVEIVAMPGHSPSTVEADVAGRLEITVPLGFDTPSPAIVGVPLQTGGTMAVTIAAA